MVLFIMDHDHRIIDQSTIFPPTAMMSKKPKIGGGADKLPNPTIEYLRSWMMSPEHVNHPYPSGEYMQHRRDFHCSRQSNGAGIPKSSISPTSNSFRLILTNTPCIPLCIDVVINCYEEEEKDKIIKDTGISSKQLTCWFSNNRKRYWKPKMEKLGKCVRDILKIEINESFTLTIMSFFFICARKALCCSSCNG